MMRVLGAALLASCLIAAQNRASAEEDVRTAISLPADVRVAFLAEMRTHMVNLDNVVAALAEDDFKQAAWIADIHMTFGHRRWEKMVEDGATEEEIAAAKARFKDMRGSQSGQGGGGMGMGMGMGMGPGIGRFMPEDFRTMGAMFHEAAEAFAETTRSVSTPATPADYRAVLEALQEVTAACRACHDAFRVEAPK